MSEAEQEMANVPITGTIVEPSDVGVGNVVVGTPIVAVAVTPIAVVIPAGATVGTVVSVIGPSGQPMPVMVPPGKKPGQTWNVAVPTVAAPMPLGLPGLAALLGNAKTIEINQKVQLLEAVSGGCCEQRNHFDIKLDGKDGPTVLTAKEKSKCLDRVCCKPNHSLLVHIAPAYDEENVMLTMERKGCECSKCCFSEKPGLGLCTCSDACTNEVVLHAGKVTKEDGELVGANPVSTIRQPMQCCAAGGCTPTLEVFSTSAEEPHARVTGPTCFGGWSELCCANHFKYNSLGKGGGGGEITHVTPRGCCEIFKFMFTDSDVYRVDFDTEATPEDKASMIATSILVDYMFFEIDNGLCTCKDDQIYCTLSLCFCMGCLIPCNCICPNPCGAKGSAGGAPPAAETASGAPAAPDAVETQPEMAR